MIEDLYKKFILSRGVSTDTRTIAKGELYIALVGENFDGHDFVGEALRKGASCVVVHAPCAVAKRYRSKIFFVQNTTKALKSLATLHRKKFDIPVVAIAGSNGKTTTKQIVAAVLSQKYDVLVSPKSYNNEIGVSLTLLKMKNHHELVILEIGTNSPGEIKSLVRLSLPTHGLVTSIGKEHLEGFNDIRGVEEEEFQLYKWLSEHKGTIFLNNELPRRMLPKGDYALIKYSFAEVKVHSVFPVRFAYKVDKEKYTVCSRMVGEWNIKNIVSAIVVARYFSIPAKIAIESVSNFTSQDLRGEVVRYKNNQALLDCYNANPSSMAELFKLLRNVKQKSVFLVIGGMRELGDASIPEHKKIFNIVHKNKWGDVVFVGEEYAFLKDKIEKLGYRYFTTTALAKKYIDHVVFPKNSILVLKGSRSYALENIIK